MARSDSFVGRERELAELWELWGSAAGGRGGFIVVSGDPGIGKTRLVERFADEVGADAHLCWGGCSDGDAPALSTSARAA